MVGVFDVLVVMLTLSLVVVLMRFVTSWICFCEIVLALCMFVMRMWIVEMDLLGLRSWKFGGLNVWVVFRVVSRVGGWVR